MIFLADSLPDISKVPPEFTQNYILVSGFVIVIGLQVFNATFNAWSQRQTKKREISGTVQTEPVKQHAERAELLALAATVNALREESESRIKAMHTENVENMKAMREENVALHRNGQVAGENRVMAITQDVNAEMSALGMKIGDITKMITTALIDNGAQGEAINNIKAQLHLQQGTISEMHKRIDGIIQTAPKRTSP